MTGSFVIKKNRILEILFFIIIFLVNLKMTLNISNFATANLSILFYFFYFVIFGHDTCFFRFDQQFDNPELRMHGIDELRNIHTFLLQVGYDIQGCFILNLIIYN